MISVGGGAIAAISRRSRRVGATRGGPLFAVPASTTALSRRGDAGRTALRHSRVYDRLVASGRRGGGPSSAVETPSRSASRRGDAGADRFPFWSLLSVIFLHFEKNESGPAEYF